MSIKERDNNKTTKRKVLNVKGGNSESITDLQEALSFLITNRDLINEEDYKMIEAQFNNGNEIKKSLSKIVFKEVTTKKVPYFDYLLHQSINIITKFDATDIYKTWVNIKEKDVTKKSLFQTWTDYGIALDTLPQTDLSAYYLIVFNEESLTPKLTVHMMYGLMVSCLELNPIYLCQQPFLKYIAKQAVSFVFVYPAFKDEKINDYVLYLQNIKEIVKSLDENSKAISITIATDKYGGKDYTSKITIKTSYVDKLENTERCKSLLKNKSLLYLVEGFIVDTCKMDKMIENIVHNAMQPKHHTKYHNIATMQNIDLYVFNIVMSPLSLYEEKENEREYSARVQHLEFKDKQILHIVVNPLWKLQDRLDTILSLVQKKKPCLLLLEDVTNTNTKIKPLLSSRWKTEMKSASKTDVFQSIQTFLETYQKTSVSESQPINVYYRMSHAGKFYSLKNVVNFYDRNLTILDKDKEKWRTIFEQFNYISDLWWAKYYFDPIHSCKHGRLFQIYGTCWFNSYLNMVFLTKEVREEIHKTWLTVISDQKMQKAVCPNWGENMCIDFNQIPILAAQSADYDNMMRNILLQLYANIYIYDYKPRVDFDEQLVLRLALLQKKSEGNSDITDDIKNVIAKGESLKNYMYTFDEGNVIGYKQFHKLLQTVLVDKDKVMSIDNNSLKKEISSKIEDIYILDENSANLKNAGEQMPLFLVVELKVTSPSKVPESISFYKNKYSLKSGILFIYGLSNHVLMGFSCNGINYVYDSQYTELIECNWYNLRNIQLHERYQNKIGSSMNVQCKFAIYCKDEENTVQSVPNGGSF
jgi:hypothetical protein